MNIVAFFHAYKFTHFVTEKVAKTKSPEKLNSFDKFKSLIFGVNNPRPTNKQKPAKYKDVKLQSNKKIDCWYLQNSDSSKGTIILFHGYNEERSSMLDNAEEFENLNTLIKILEIQQKQI